jgi:DNA invertase Pin-like site-specific DNA recombinase
MINQLKRHEIQVLFRAGHTQKDIAGLAKVSVHTVRRIVEEPTAEHVDDDAE